ncbi:hypothetical protein B0H12DRAFT_295300 [Mycena haematopus]|nr:hypothetical protein B0H12DRAFT_295300 [Mycena haematopus]
MSRKVRKCNVLTLFGYTLLLPLLRVATWSWSRTPLPFTRLEDSFYTLRHLNVQNAPFRLANAPPKF